MNIVLKLESLLLKFERVIMLVVGLFLPTIITVGVIFRYILNTDLYAIEEIEVFLAIWFYFIGSAYASYKKSQITADLLQATIKSYTIRKYIAVIAAAFTVLIGIAFCYWSFDMINYAWVKKPQTAVTSPTTASTAGQTAGRAGAAPGSSKGRAARSAR